jgi:hypothetical protein
LPPYNSSASSQPSTRSLPGTIQRRV